MFICCYLASTSNVHITIKFASIKRFTSWGSFCRRLYNFIDRRQNLSCICAPTNCTTGLNRYSIS